MIGVTTTAKGGRWREWEPARTGVHTYTALTLPLSHSKPHTAPYLAKLEDSLTYTLEDSWLG